MYFLGFSLNADLQGELKGIAVLSVVLEMIKISN